MAASRADSSGFAAQPLPGGFSGETFRVDGPSGPAVLRVYGREPRRAAVDAALLTLVRGLVPVPTVLDLRRADPSRPEAPAHLLTTLEPGERLDVVLQRAGRSLRQTLATSLADVLATLSGIPFLRPAAFADADLTLAVESAPAEDLVAWLDHQVRTSVLSTWDPGLLRGLATVCAHADDQLAAIRRSCLVHSDFNPKNILVDPAGAVTSVLDWEYAYAGSPFADLGNLLRFERDPVFVDAVLAAYVDRVPDAAEDSLDNARAADLAALIELAARRGENRVTERADDLLQEIARTGDLHAWPR